MRVTINYGEDRLMLMLPDDTAFDEFAPATTSEAVGINEFRAEIDSAAKSLFPLEETELYVVNDAYRPTPSARILKWIQSLGKLNEKAKFLVATGCHQSQNESQLKNIFGDLYSSIKYRIFVHDAFETDKLIKIGNDSFGKPVWLNPLFLNSRKVVVIGSVEPHYFAGFTGGRKSIFPGLCDFGTTARNHNLAISFNAAPMKLHGNPVAEHLQSLMRLLTDNTILGIQAVLCGSGRLAGIFCGDLESSFKRSCELASKLFGIKVKNRYDLLLAEVLPPLDSNLYQLQKSLENCQNAVADKGTILLFSHCDEGIGSDYFYNLCQTWSPVNAADLDSTESFGIHKLRRVYDISRRVNVRLKSNLPDKVSDKVFYKTENDPQVLIDKLAGKKRNQKVCLVHDAGHTVLINRI